MSVAQLIEVVENLENLNAPVICFTGSHYPVLFFSKFFKSLKKQNIRTIDAQAVDFVNMQVELSTSFLGDRIVYWLKDLSECSTYDFWLSYIASYQGPHILLFFSSRFDEIQGKLPAKAVVRLPELINRDDYAQLLSFFDIRQGHQLFVTRLFSHYKTIPLDNALLFSSYNFLVGRLCSEFFDTWLDALMPEKKSLFILSQYFFAKQGIQFFALWHKMRPDFMPEFWIAFWAEQLWQAFCFMHYAQKNNLIEGKKYAYRLPFSFIQRDWKKQNKREIIEAHQFLYDIDYQMKNGGDVQIALELFYIKFIRNCF